MKDKKVFSMSKYARTEDMYRDMAKYYKERCEELEEEIKGLKEKLD